MDALGEFLARQPREVLLAQPDYNEYFEALTKFWQGDTAACLAAIGAYLVAHPECEQKSRWYRLWIEALATQQDFDSLGLLLEHFTSQAALDTEGCVSWLALQGLVHLERDHQQACQLLRPFLESQKCAYSMEFTMRLQWRESGAEVPAGWLGEKLVLHDYWHWLAWCRLLWSQGDETSLGRCLAHSEDLFPYAPIRDEFMAHIWIDKVDFSKACTYTDKLVRRFPKQAEYAFLHGYVLQHLGDWEAAVTWFQQVVATDPTDVDALAAIGYCRGRQAAGDVYSMYWQKFSVAQQQAVAACEKLGFLPLDLLYTYQNLAESDTAPGERRQGSESGFWLLHIPQVQAASLAAATADELQTRFGSLKPQARQGDVVFYVVEDGVHAGTLRLVAIYEVRVPPQGMLKFDGQAVLSLIEAFRLPILLGKVPQVSEPDRRRLDEARKPQRGACYKLEASGVDAILAALNEAGSLDSYYEHLINQRLHWSG